MSHKTIEDQHDYMMSQICLACWEFGLKQFNMQVKKMGRVTSCQRYWGSLQSEQELGEHDAFEEDNTDVSESGEDLAVEDPFIRNWEKLLPVYKCILQHEVLDWRYDKKGWFLMVHYDHELAIVSHYDEASYYSSQAGMDCNEFMWQGSVKQLVSMAKLKLDPCFPQRQFIPEDHQYLHWHMLFDGIVAWDQLGRPDWSQTSRWGPFRADQRASYSGRTPFATNITTLYKDWSRAATVIQAAWRVWKTRFEVALVCSLEPFVCCRSQKACKRSCSRNKYRGQLKPVLRV